MPIENVSDTARWVAMYRAMETARPDALFRISSAARDEVLRRVAGVSRSALVVTEGLLVYLTAEQVSSLARALHVQPSIRWWLTDIASPLLLRYMERTWGKAVRSGNAPFQFAIDDRAGFFQPLGWREAEFRSGMDESRRLGREMPMAWLWRAMMRLQSRRRHEALRTTSGYMLLERR